MRPLEDIEADAKSVDGCFAEPWKAPKLQKDLLELVAAVRERDSRIAELMQALKMHGRHRESCQSVRDYLNRRPIRPCDCSFGRVLGDSPAVAKRDET